MILRIQFQVEIDGGEGRNGDIFPSGEIFPPVIFAVFLGRAPLEAIRGGSPQENATLILSLLAGEPGSRLDIVLANAAAALVVSGVAEDFKSAAELARGAVASGEARKKLDQLREFSRKDALKT